MTDPDEEWVAKKKALSGCLSGSEERDAVLWSARSAQYACSPKRKRAGPSQGPNLAESGMAAFGMKTVESCRSRQAPTIVPFTAKP
jgi:hypothetical protein